MAHEMNQYGCPTHAFRLGQNCGNRGGGDAAPVVPPNGGHNWGVAPSPEANWGRISTGATSMRRITKTLRFEVLTRDGYRCRYCGASAPDARLEIDHVRSVASGGSDEIDNLVTACTDCNAGKSDRDLCPVGEALVLSKDKGPGRLAKAQAAKIAASDPTKHFITSDILDIGDEADGQSMARLHCESHGCDEWHWIDDYEREAVEAWGSEGGWLYGKARKA